MIHGLLSTELAEALPREVVDALDLLPGDEIEFPVVAGGVRISRPADHVETELGLTTDQLQGLIQEALDDPRPPIPAEEAFAELRTRIEQRHRNGA